MYPIKPNKANNICVASNEKCKYLTGTVTIKSINLVPTSKDSIKKLFCRALLKYPLESAGPVKENK
jgi:hypothetical protein